MLRQPGRSRWSATSRPRPNRPSAASTPSGSGCATSAMWKGGRSHRLPAISTERAFAEQDGLMAYQEYTLDTERRVAVFVDKILKGAKPADLPVEQPTKFDLVINLKTAKALGLTIPLSLLARADQVIE